ncbi:hypothetical protein [Azomonas macrocytogenes]|uniref:Uncharacterized protein n=1 Tax=Azomonas macrocytogenes TaxID=69962 RepID=A0A839T5W5_AZOMA|nr:hypothetical protein [Azomonas macrocytogenes]MBB3104439.1 hypothetical protein [Azomonas macrocytogenes]
MSRAMDTLTQQLIETLTELLRSHPAAALQSLQVGAPALIDSLEQIKLRAVDRREINALLQLHFPQADEAKDALLQLPVEVSFKGPHRAFTRVAASVQLASATR